MGLFEKFTTELLQASDAVARGPPAPRAEEELEEHEPPTLGVVAADAHPGVAAHLRTRTRGRARPARARGTPSRRCRTASTAFTDHIDDDGIDPDPIPITVAVTVRATDEADFAGSAPQVHRARSTRRCRSRKSAVYACVRHLIGGDAAQQRGLLPPDRGRRAAGHAGQSGPAGVGRRARPDRLPHRQRGVRRARAGRARPRVRVRGRAATPVSASAATTPSGAPSCSSSSSSAPGAADRPATASTAAAARVVNFSNNPIEVIESEYPLADRAVRLPARHGRRRPVPRRAWRWCASTAFSEAEGDAPAPHRPPPLHALRPGRGGGRARPPRNVLNPGTPRRASCPRKCTLTGQARRRLPPRAAGAGGWGDPFDARSRSGSLGRAGGEDQRRVRAARVRRRDRPHHARDPARRDGPPPHGPLSGPRRVCGAGVRRRARTHDGPPVAIVSLKCRPLFSGRGCSAPTSTRSDPGRRRPDAACGRRAAGPSRSRAGARRCGGVR